MNGRTFCLLVVFLVAGVLSCGGDKTTKPSTQGGSLSLPYAENFDGDERVIQQRWDYVHSGTPAFAHDVFEVSTNEYASAPRAMRSASERGEGSATYHGEFYYGGRLALRQDLDLSRFRTARLSFQDRRDVNPTVPLPSWQAGEINDSSCHVQVSINSGQTWSDLVVYRTDAREWTLESVSLESAVGRAGVRIAFTVPQHAVGGRSTTWCIDDVVITGE
jgi:hypothetical protein